MEAAPIEANVAVMLTAIKLPIDTVSRHRSCSFQGLIVFIIIIIIKLKKINVGKNELYL
jgi:hypothetical protein